ncbi:MAG: zinc-binding dehydrogenase [Streptosporangiales bacterium]|nr:zinc-binding dehydrogenase [Streptosporangiales bacterium]
MRRVVCREFGPVEKLVVEEEPDPEPGPGEVLVSVRTAGVSFVDGLLVRGGYQVKPELPFTPGMAVAGDVAAVGKGVTAPAVGDPVLGLCGRAGYASAVLLPAASAVPLPSGLSYEAAAACVEGYSTMLFAFTRRAPLNPGDVVLVLGAGGGVGLAAVDIAHNRGARVIAAASTADKREAALAAGAEAVIDYTNEDVKLRARELGGGGVDMVVDPVGGDHAEPALRALRPFGRYLVLGFASGTIPRLPANHTLLMNRSIIGVDWGDWGRRDPAAGAALTRELADLLAAGGVRPPEPSTYPLERAAEALTAIIERRATGKLALTP